MNVSWQLPDGSVREQTVTDTEQLMFLLRMVGGVCIEGASYRVAGTALIVNTDNMSVAVSLERP